MYRERDQGVSAGNGCLRVCATWHSQRASGLAGWSVPGSIRGADGTDRAIRGNMDFPNLLRAPHLIQGIRLLRTLDHSLARCGNHGINPVPRDEFLVLRVARKRSPRVRLEFLQDSAPGNDIVVRECHLEAFFVWTLDARELRRQQKAPPPVPPVHESFEFALRAAKFHALK